MLFVALSVAAVKTITQHSDYRIGGINDDPDPKVSQVEILHSDVLYKRSEDPRADVLVANVKLRHEGAYLDCDSARYYKDDNSFYAYGRVYLVQGDTV